MNNEQIEKIINQIKTIDIQPEDTVVLYYNREYIDFNSLLEIYELLQKSIPNKILAIPEEISFKSLDKESLIKIRDNLNQLIEFGDIKGTYQ